jgi:hypothetical protein
MGYAIYTPGSITVYDATPEEWVDKSYPRYTVVKVRPDALQVVGGYAHGAGLTNLWDWQEDLAQIISLLAPVEEELSIEVPGVGDYTATVDKEGIHVGCQTISFSSLAEINRAAVGVKKSLK